MKLCASILFIISFSAFALPSVQVQLTGHLRSKSHKKVSHISIVLKAGEQNNRAQGITDAKGNFTLDFDDGMHRTEPLLLYYVNKHKDTVLLKKIGGVISETPEMTFWIK